MNFLRGILIHGFSLEFYFLWKDGLGELSQPSPTYIEKAVIFIKICTKIVTRLHPTFALYNSYR